MKIPKKLKIGGHEVAVEVGYFDDSGEWDSKKNRILISDRITRSQQEVTLIHEILHVMNAVLDHTLLDSLSEQIYQVLSDNKMLK